MWSVSLGLPADKYYCLDYIEKMLADSGEVTTALKVNYTRAELSVAAESAGRAPELIADMITDIITGDFKYDYLINNSRLSFTNPLHHSALLTALVVFDSEYDREYCKKEMELSDVFMIDGFFSFRLSELRKRWAEICELANSNIYFFCFEETYYELMRFLTGTIPVRGGVSIRKTDDGIVLREGEKQTRIEDERDLINTLIFLSPKSIEIARDVLTPEGKEFLANLYEERLIIAND